MRWCMPITDADRKVSQVTPKRYTQVGAIVLIAMVALASLSCAEFEHRDKRFYYRALWNFALRENLKALDIEFNGVDFGHANLYENLLLTGAKDIPAIEDRARKETLRFIATR